MSFMLSWFDERTRNGGADVVIRGWEVTKALLNTTPRRSIFAWEKEFATAVHPVGSSHALRSSSNRIGPCVAQHA